MKFELHFTQSGLPALWEEGGGYSNKGTAQVIANADGSAKNPIHVRKKGHLACAQHGLFIVRPGDYVIRVNRHRDEYEVRIFRIETIENNEAICSIVDEQDEQLAKAIEAAKKKARCYHCRDLHYDRGTYRVRIIRKHTFSDGSLVTLGEANKKKYFITLGEFSGKEIPRKKEDTEWFYDLESAEKQIQEWDTLKEYSVRAEKEVEEAFLDPEMKESLEWAFGQWSKGLVAHKYYLFLWRNNGRGTFAQFVNKNLLEKEFILKEKLSHLLLKE